MRPWYHENRQKPSTFLHAERSTCELLVVSENSNAVPTWATYMLICASTKLPLEVRLCRNMIHAVSTWILHKSLHDLLKLANCNSFDCISTRCARHIVFGNHTHQQLMYLLAAGPNVTETHNGFEISLLHDIQSVERFSDAFSVNKRQPRTTLAQDQTPVSQMHPRLAYIVSGTTVMFRAIVDIGVASETINFCLKQQVKKK